jgi:hypothetical protein
MQGFLLDFGIIPRFTIMAAKNKLNSQEEKHYGIHAP